MGVVALLCCVGCSGTIGGDGVGDGPTAATLSEIGESGLRRLTAKEYDASIFDLVGVDVDSETALPEDLRFPFDNDFTHQLASEALISAADSLAGQVAEAVVADTSLRAAIVPCTPSGADDTTCYRSFVESFGRRAFRRPLVAGEVDRFMSFMDHASQAGDFWTAIDSALRAFLQHPAFLYRVELGSAVAGQEGVFRLSDYELATRISYTLIGSTPPVWLLDLAGEAGLSDAEGVRAAVAQMLLSDQAKERVSRFHSMWLSYERLPHAPDLAADLKLETDALLQRVIFDERGAWVDLLRSDETYLTTDLAAHYGLPAPTQGQGWVRYGDSGRQGLLSQGSFLSAVAKFDDTSPVQRGLLIRTRLFCQTLNPPPPELNVNVDEPPEGPDPNACKTERYNMWQLDACKSCHAMLEPVGFGLENYDTAGRYRDHETDRPECAISGEGALEGVGSFSGPSELANLMIDAGGVDECVATMMYRFTMGRFELGDHDHTMLERLVPAAQRSGELSFYDLVVELLSSDGFRYRREEVAP